MNFLVVGAGDMGTWLGGALAADTDADVAFADADPSAADRAASATGGRTVPLDTDERFDAVCLAVPLPAVADAVAEHAGRADRALLDVSGVMDPAVRAMREHAPDRERVSLHPLFAPDAAPGNVAVVADEPGLVTDRVRTTLTDRGNDLFETTAEEHDRAMRTVQARAHAAVLAYGLAAEPVREEFQTPVSRALGDLVDRVTGGTARVYADIQSTFDGAEDVAEAARRVADADDEAFAALYREARPGLSDHPDRPDDAGEGR
ncbi:prephenate dehydrogenase/arogenate dehydrogenase family protein [Halomarina litorea]|uniref:prephenate dehydrogenase/arogenate dehydrogenase family protein n=1 Tax=Halomarina litorea TaxID=2961595 RepID=UPI0020C28BD7|nr:prephenate dehydrogenase/arogenate dehydrogenase family protein [Halomarina sp. BCD28]